MEIKNVLLSIVIVSWNSEKQTIECITSVYNSEDFVYLKDRLELIVIDNNSSDRTTQLIKQQFPSVILIENNENTGYAPACNQGMKRASGKYTLLLGSDTVLKNKSLINCIEYLELNENCAAAGCKLFYPDGRLQGNCKKFPTLKNAFYTYLSLDKLNYDYDMLWFNYDKTMQVDQIATTFLMVRSDTLKNINYFDERFRIMYNDVDLCKKIYFSGKYIVFLHTAEVIHHGSLSTKKADFKVRRIMYSDIYLYYKLNFKSKALLLLPVLFVRFLLVSILR